MKQLDTLASSVGLTLPQLALAWVLRFRHVTSAIVGVTSKAQMEENLGALTVSAEAPFWGEVSVILECAGLGVAPPTNA